MKKYKRRMTSSRVIILGFAGVILLGTLLLMLPIASQSGKVTSFLDALFTATSAVCVTGLVVHDTATYWSMFGQTIILILIQIGGMGVITLAVTFSLIAGKKISLKQRSIMQEAISAHHVGGIVRLTGFIVRMTIFFEGVGALIMAPTFCKEFGLLRGIWYSVFHSISAFCNAGFDLMGRKSPYSSLTYFADRPAINLTVMALIVIGGIGFLTWDDIKTNKLNFKKYRMQSKVILVTTAILILLPAAYLYFLEFSEVAGGKRVLFSFFQSITLRTAGFNTADLTKISEVGLAIMICMMLIGGSPGSTAGGMKTTTVATLFSSAVAVFRGKEYTQFFGRRVEDGTIHSAATILTMYLTLFLTGGCIISRVEGIPLITCLFETASAVGTVGLTLGITPGLGALSRCILIVLMYCGRVGGLTLVFAAFSSRPTSAVRLPQEKLTVG